MSSTSTPIPRRSIMRGGRVLWALVLIFALASAGLVAYVLTNASAQTTYYVLNTNVQARQQITPEMLTAINTKRGGAPAVAETPGDLTGTPTFAKYDISAGNLVTTDNAGPLVSLQKGLPTNYVVASFKADPSAAAGGTITRGDYINIYSVNGDTHASHLFLTRVLVVSATSDLDSSTTTSNSTDQGGSAGSDSSSSSDSSSAATTTSTTTVPFLFTVGVTPEDAAKIATARSTSQDAPLYITLSSADQVNQADSGDNVGASTSDVFGGAATDAGTGTDSSFTNSSPSQQSLIAAPVQAGVKQSVTAIDKVIKANPKAGGSDVQGALPDVSGVSLNVIGDAAGYVVTGSANGYTYTYNSQTKVYAASATAETAAEKAAAAATN